MTKKQRLIGYTFALKELKTKGNLFVCLVLDNYAFDNKIKTVDDVEIDFPEFYAQKPTHVDKYSSWWIDLEPENRLKYRKNGLKEAIKMILKPKK